MTAMASTLPGRGCFETKVGSLIRGKYASEKTRISPLVLLLSVLRIQPVLMWIFQAAFSSLLESGFEY
jgi:hypothetical protein